MNPRRPAPWKCFARRALNKKVLVMGFDASKQLLQSIRDGDIIGSILQDPYRMGYVSTWMCVRHLRGEDVNSNRTDMNLSTGEYLVTKENVDSDFVLACTTRSHRRNGLRNHFARDRRRSESIPYVASRGRPRIRIFSRIVQLDADSRPKMVAVRYRRERSCGELLLGMRGSLQCLLATGTASAQTPASIPLPLPPRPLPAPNRTEFTDPIFSPERRGTPVETLEQLTGERASEAGRGERDEIETDRDSFTPATTTAGRRRLIVESAYSSWTTAGSRRRTASPN